ncbi:DNA replication/repair protein RecF [Flaviflagellibacter deserti]|uniref:DNA replication and repair protein RecF n=1 Tax=Flaviflagellibacter deserti TaxID=2267266 RepID=A0ABV9Z481_9HYPH
MTATDSAPLRVAIHRLRLTQFRNHPTLDIVTGGRDVALIGPNGAGKTNILEAVSMLAPGRGLRRATLPELSRAEGPGGWTVSADLEGAFGEAKIGTGTEQGEGEGGRKVRINGANAPSAGALSDHLRIVWLTPSMDGLFSGSAGDRRRFLDRLVLAVDPDHGTRVSAFERALRSRNRLLEEPGSDPRWLDAVEREVAELAVATAAARIDTVGRLSALIAETRDDDDAFPHAEISLGGWMEGEIEGGNAADVEDAYRGRLRDLRNRDRAAGRTIEGPHASDLSVGHGRKQAPAARCSTGEQKALLLGLVLAHARLVARLSGSAPVALLDEVSAHLDPQRRRALYERLQQLGSQVWMTGADPALFDSLPGETARFAISSGHAEPMQK